VCALLQLGITTGIFAASILGYGMVTYVNHGWQYIQVRIFKIYRACVAVHSSNETAPKCVTAVYLQYIADRAARCSLSTRRASAACPAS
jgi:hypothetical protein